MWCIERLLDVREEIGAGGEGTVIDGIIGDGHEQKPSLKAVEDRVQRVTDVEMVKYLTNTVG